MAHRLTIQFATEEEFRAEFAANIANGGIFVATNEPPELRSRVEVEMQLRYLDQSITMVGEVVHCVPAELAATGAFPGAAIHFDDCLAAILETFAPYTDGGSPVERVSSPADSRRVERFPASVATRIRTVGQPEGASDAGRTRNLSRYGALVAHYGEPVPVGETITIAITHPSTGEEFEVEGTVKRHETSESGEVTGLGVEFHLPESKAEDSARFLDEVKGREHSRRLGAITGPIAELGISTLLTMFGSCAPGGTLTVSQGGEEGLVAFEGGMLRAVQLGAERGKRALARMLEWHSGTFEFRASVDSDRFDGDPIPLEQALLEALQSQDEKCRDKIQLRSNTKLRINRDAAEEAKAELSQIDQAILELAGVGMAVGKIVEIIPESKREIAQALTNLVKRGVIAPE